MDQFDSATERYFEEFFRRATKGEKGPSCYDSDPIQKKFPASMQLPELIGIPANMDKNDAIIFDCVWRERFDLREEIRSRAPIRLVYSLLLRLLEGQIQDKSKRWLESLGVAFMGDEDKWDFHPKRDTILIRTKDMMPLSTALNSGCCRIYYHKSAHFEFVNFELFGRYLLAA